MKKKRYEARWYNPVTLQKTADVTIMASTDPNAIRAANKIGREMGKDNANLEIYEGSRLVCETRG